MGRPECSRVLPSAPRVLPECSRVIPECSRVLGPLCMCAGCAQVMHLLFFFRFYLSLPARTGVRRVWASAFAARAARAAQDRTTLFAALYSCNTVCIREIRGDKRRGRPEGQRSKRESQRRAAPRRSERGVLPPAACRASHSEQAARSRQATAGGNLVAQRLRESGLKLGLELVGPRDIHPRRESQPLASI